MKKKLALLEFLKDNFFELLFSIPKTIIFNFSILPFHKAIKFPIIISYHVKTKGVNRESFVYDSEFCSFASTRIGLGSTRYSINESKKGLINIESGKIIIKENTGLSQGIILDAVNGSIELGKHFRCNYLTTISSVNDKIIIGDETSLGWKVSIKNFDGHYIIENGKIKTNHGPIIIGNKVWICSNTTIMKNVNIGNNSVLSYGSILCNNITAEENVLYAGIPAKKIKENIDWKE